MPDSFLQFVLRDTEWDPFRKIREHMIGMTPEPVIFGKKIQFSYTLKIRH